MKNKFIAVAICLGFIIGIALSFSPSADASRNSSGSYTQPNGTSATTHTTISSTAYNTLISDIGTELTNSLDRNGRGGMLAPLQCSNGTVAAPALTFSSETGSGLYRAGAGDIRMSVGSTDVAKYQSTGVTFPVGLPNGVTVTQATTNGNGITTTGNGTGAGTNATGGASNGYGVLGTGGATNGGGVKGQGTGNGAGITGIGGATGVGGTFAGGATAGNGIQATGGATSGVGGQFTGGSPNGTGAVGQGTGAGVGVYGAGGSTSGAGLQGNGGSPNGVGVSAQGVGTGQGIVATGGANATGGTFFAGTASTATTPQNSISAGNGNLFMNGTANPNSSVGFQNVLTPKNIVKAFGKISVINGNGTLSIDDAFNVSSVSLFNANTIQVNLASAFASTAFVAVCSHSTSTGSEACYTGIASSSSFYISEFSSTGSAINFSTTNDSVSFIAMGAQ